VYPAGPEPKIRTFVCFMVKVPMVIRGWWFRVLG